MGQILRYRIIFIEEQVPKVKIFRMEPVAGAIPIYKAGQFAFVHILDGKGSSLEKRPYSIASPPSSPYLEFCIKNTGGKMTSMLDKLIIGSVVGIDLPYGNFAYEGQRRAALIGGGSGIAPLVGILRDIAARRIDGSFVLFYSAKRRDSIIYNKELERLSKTHPQIKAVVTLTQETPKDWIGECGRINESMIKKHLDGLSDFDWWVCGPLPLVKGMKECLVASGVDPKRMKVEGWG